MIWPGGYSSGELLRIFRDQGYSMEGDPCERYPDVFDDFPCVFIGSEIANRRDCLTAVFGPLIIAPLGSGDRIGFIDNAKDGGKKLTPLDRDSVILNRDMLLSWLSHMRDGFNANLEKSAGEPDYGKVNDYCAILEYDDTMIVLGACFSSLIGYRAYGAFARKRHYLSREGRRHLIFSRDNPDEIRKLADTIYTWADRDLRSMHGKSAWHEEIPAPAWCFG